MAAATDQVHKIKILLKDLTTKSVTFGPQQATVVRVVPNVEIQPGPNEITIYGLDPSINLDSIRVEGRGPATITDIQTELVPQKDRFEDAFPLRDPELGDREEEFEDDDKDYGVDKSELLEAKQALKALEEDSTRARKQQEIASTSQSFLDSYGKSLKAKESKVKEIEDYVNMYQRQSSEISETRHQAEKRGSDLRDQIMKLNKKVNHLQARYEKACKAASKEEREQKEKEERERERREAEWALRLHQQRKFWPNFVNQIVLHLDGFPGFTPNSSRRSSIVSTKKEDVSADTSENTVNLSLTYVTTQASWAPRYELSLNTPTSSGKIVYRAEFENSSSETWRDAKINLSTSQTSFSGLSEKIPWLQPWHVKLDKETEILGGKKGSNWSGGLESRNEHLARKNQKVKLQIYNTAQNQSQAQFQASGISFGQRVCAVAPAPPPASLFGAAPAASAPPPAGPFGGAPAAASAPKSGGLFGSLSPNPPGFGSFGGAASRPSGFGALGGDVRPSASTGGGLFNRPPIGHVPETEDFEDSEDSEDSDSETATLSDALMFQESSRQEHGLTTTYEIPGTRTLSPSGLKRRHVIAELDLASVTLSHVIVPKLRGAAFLKAKIKNTSPVALLRGQAGLTLDGTFLGTTQIPNCSPGNIFSLPLGVDPGIVVSYPKPTVRRATSGFFNKEDSAIFSRVCRITNTKSTLVSVLMLDQVPVSEDDRLRMQIIEPRGLSGEDDSVKLGGDGKASWGKGTATLGKGGEVKWEATILKGKEVKLVLEYEARIPSGQKIVGLA